MSVKTAAASSLHSNVPVSLLENMRVGLASFDGLAGTLSVAVGLTVSTVQLRVSSGPIFPALSIARTWNVCPPSARPGYVMPLEQALKIPLSSLHWKLPASDFVNVRVAVADGWKLPSAGTGSICHRRENRVDDERGGVRRAVRALGGDVVDAVDADHAPGVTVLPSTLSVAVTPAGVVTLTVTAPV